MPDTTYPIHCAHDAVVPLADLIPNPKNPNSHPDHQVALIAQVIQVNGWRAPITVSRLSGMIVRGHGRLLAAQLLKETAAPVDYQEYPSEYSEMADLVADNAVAELSRLGGLDLRTIFSSLPQEFYPATGKTDDEIEDILAGVADQAVEPDPNQIKSDMQNFRATPEQATTIRAGIAKVREDRDDLSEGRCLELIVADYLAG